MKHILGLKVGISSIGYCLLKKKGHDSSIIKTGVHLFSAPEDPKTKESLRSQLTAVKSNRERIKRNKKRLKRLAALLNTFVKRNNLPPIRTKDDSGRNIWRNRALALDTFMEPKDLFHVLYHMGNHRGYYAHVKEENQNKTGMTGAVNAALEKNDEMRQQFRSCSEFLATRPTFRNKRGEYTNILKREWLRQDFNLLRSAQARFYGEQTDKYRFFENDELVLLEELMFDQNYLKNKLDEIGTCALLPEEKRLCRSHPMADEFVFLSKLLHGDWINVRTGEVLKMTADILGEAHDLYIQNDGKLTQSNLKKAMGLTGKDKIFNRNIKGTVIHENALITKLSPVLGSFGPRLHEEGIEKVMQVLSFVYCPKEKVQKLKEIGCLTHGDYSEWLELPRVSGTIGFSLKVVSAILDYMWKGLSTQEAIEHARFKGDLPKETQSLQLKLLPAFAQTPNQIINRSAALCRKIINNIITQYGDISEIHLEIGKELGKSVEARRKINKQNKAFQYLNETAKSFLEENNLKNTHDNVKLYRLWKSQKERDVLTTEPITIDDIRTDNAIAIFINPNSLNRSYYNMLLILKKNEDRVDELMMEHVERVMAEEGNEEQANDYKIKQMISRLKLGENAPSNNLVERSDWLLKNISNHIKKNMFQMEVVTFPREVVRFLKQTDLDYLQDIEKQEDFLPHHRQLIDSILLAHLEKSHVERLQVFLNNPNTSHFSFDIKLDADTMVSQIQENYPTLQPRRKLSGEANAQTLLRVLDPKLKKLPSGERIVFPKDREQIRNDPVKTYLLKKIPLQKITRANFHHIQNFEDIPFLRERLLSRLEKAGWDAEKAFKKPFKITFYTRKGKVVTKRRNPIYNVLVYDDSRSVVAFKGAAANYGDMVATNIYKFNQRFYGSPIYAMDILRLKTKKARKEECTFPNTYIGGNEMPIDPNAKFVCRLQYGDKVRFDYPPVLDALNNVTKVSVTGYYNSYNRSTNAVILVHSIEETWTRKESEDDARYVLSSRKVVTEPLAKSIMKLQSIRKIHVTILGDEYPQKNVEIPLIR